MGAPTATNYASFITRSDSIRLDSPTIPFKASPLIYPTGKFRSQDEYPSLAVTDNGKVWLSYTHCGKNKSEAIYLKAKKDKGFSKAIQISKLEDRVYQSRIISHENKLYIVWTSHDSEGNGMIRLNSFDGKKLTGERLVSHGGTINRNPVLAKEESGRIHIAWERSRSGKMDIATRSFYNGKFSDIVTLSDFPEKDCQRPSIVVDKKNQLCCSYDVYSGKGNYDIYLTRFTRKEKQTIQISNDPAGDLASSIDVDQKNKLWIAWASNRDHNGNADIPRWFELRAVKGNRIYEPAESPTWIDLDRDGEIQSFEFPKVTCADDGKVFVTGRASHAFYIQYYYGDTWSDLYRVPQDGWGGRGKYMETVITPDQTIYCAFRGLGANAMMTLSDWHGKYKKAKIYPAKSEVENVIHNISEKYHFKSQGDLNFYFGDIHGHSWMSDGMNDIDEFYIYYRDVLQDDFCSLSDHDNFVGNRILPSEWLENKETTQYFNQKNQFVTLFGQEWTTARYPKGYGHKNIYHIDEKIPLYDHKEKGTKTTKQLFPKLKKIGAIAIPHHIGWTGVDWEDHDPEVQNLVEIVSNHGAYESWGNEPIFHRGGIREHFVQDGLNKGLKFGIVGGSDSHGLIWHHQAGWKRNCHRTGMTCIIAPELTREALFAALKNRHCYATSGIKIRLEWTINKQYIMGDEFTLPAHEKFQSKLRVTSPETLKWITLIKDGKEIQKYGGEGRESRVSYNEMPEKGTHYYYYRILTEEGNMAWTSPVFIEVK